MKEDEKSLLKRNRIAATLGDSLTQEILMEFRDRFYSEMKSYIPTANDQHAFGLHRAMGRVEAVEYLLAAGKKAVETQPTKG